MVCLWGMGDCGIVFRNVSLGGFSNFMCKSNVASHALEESVILHDEDCVLEFVFLIPF
jgi:hypothetical protein